MARIAAAVGENNYNFGYVSALLIYSFKHHEKHTRWLLISSDDNVDAIVKLIV